MRITTRRGMPVKRWQRHTRTRPWQCSLLLRTCTTHTTGSQSTWMMALQTRNSNSSRCATFPAPVAAAAAAPAQIYAAGAVVGDVAIPLAEDGQPGAALPVLRLLCSTSAESAAPSLTPTRLTRLSRDCPRHLSTSPGARCRRRSVPATVCAPAAQLSCSLGSLSHTDCSRFHNSSKGYEPRPSHDSSA